MPHNAENSSILMPHNTKNTDLKSSYKDDMFIEDIFDNPPF